MQRCHSLQHFKDEGAAMHASRRSLLIGAGVILVLASSGFIADASTVHEVEISLFQFKPAKLEIAAGDTVRWINRDGIEHSATASDRDAQDKPLFDTGLFERGQMREVAFTEPGNYTYFCRRHPSMTAIIIVREP
jgi:plastocyanin